MACAGLVHHKLVSDERLSFVKISRLSDLLFRHLIDELIIFCTFLDNQLGESRGMEHMPWLLQPWIVSRLLKVDLDFCQDRMDSILKMENGWSLLSFHSLDAEEDQAFKKINYASENCHALLLLLDSLSHRWHSFSFIFLACKYVKDLIISSLLVYIEFAKKSFETNYEVIRSDVWSVSSEEGKPVWINSISMLNSLHNLLKTLQSWNMNIWYMKLGFVDRSNHSVDATITFRDLDSNSFFQNTSRDYGFWSDSIQLCTQAFEEQTSIFVGALILFFQKCLEPYKKKGHTFSNVLQNRDSDFEGILDFDELIPKLTAIDNSPSGWVKFIETTTLGGSILSPEFCQGIAVLQAQLFLLRRYLHLEIFELIWTRLAEKLDSMLFEQFVNNRHFTWNGKDQFSQDIVGLWCVFLPFVTRPQNCFKNLRDVLIVFKWPTDVISSLRLLAEREVDCGQLFLLGGITRLSSVQVLDLVFKIN